MLYAGMKEKKRGEEREQASKDQQRLNLGEHFTQIKEENSF